MLPHIESQSQLTFDKETNHEKPQLSLLALVIPFLACNLWAQTSFVYTNNDILRFVGRNTVSGFIADKKSFLTLVPGSPFFTGGLGHGGGWVAANRIVTAGRFLYASNAFTNDISGFSIEPETGTLTPVPGSPFPTDGFNRYGPSLAVTPDGQFLYVASDRSETIRIFRIEAGDGRLIPVGDPVAFQGAQSSNGMKVSPNGRWLVLVLYELAAHGSIAIYAIDSKTGELTPVEESPFPVREPGGPEGNATGIDINCASDTLFVVEVSLGPTLVDVLRIDPETGALTPVKGSPFIGGGAYVSIVPVLSPDDSLLFVSNEDPDSVSVFDVAPDGSLSLVPGSPFPIVGAESPAGMTTDATGSYLYVAMFIGRAVQVFRIEPTGELTSVEGSPFPTGKPPGSALLSLTAYPGKSCPKEPKLESTSSRGR